eukprot:31536_1
MPRKQKNKSKSTKQKRKQQQKHNAPSTKPLRLRTSLDIYNRLLHDRTLDINLKNVFIGYTDNDNAIKRTSEMCILSWVMVNKGGDIPMHHIVYFCLILNDRSKLMIWDRHKKLDRLYGSGETQTAQKWVNIKNTIQEMGGESPLMKCITATIEFIKLYDDEKDDTNDDANTNTSCNYPQLLVGKTTRNKSKFIHPQISRKHKVIAAISAMVHKWGKLSPFHLCDDQGRRIENIWQFSKVYKSIEEQNQIKFGKVKWVYPAVKKCLDDNGTLTEEYWKWRDTGMKHQKAVRFPVGRANRFECLYSVVDRGNPQPINYIEARKKIYIPQYTAALIQCDKFKQLKRMYEDGQYLLISEFDGPLYQDYDYYQDKYGKMDIVLEGNVMIPTKENLKILLNDTKHPFGHGYCIAMALQGITVEDLL